MNAAQARKIKLPPLSHYKERFAQIKDSRHDLGFQTEIKEVPMTMREIQVETDFLLNRPPTPPYVPIKPGQDVEVQMDEIFDFNLEVQPYLDIIVDQVINDAYVKYYYNKELKITQSKIQEHKDRQFEYMVILQKFELAEKDLQEQREKQSQHFIEQQNLERQNLANIKRSKAVQNLVGTIMADVELNLWKKKFTDIKTAIAIPVITTNNLLSFPNTEQVATTLLNEIIYLALVQ